MILIQNTASWSKVQMFFAGQSPRQRCQPVQIVPSHTGREKNRKWGEISLDEYFSPNSGVIKHWCQQFREKYIVLFSNIIVKLRWNEKRITGNNYYREQYHKAYTRKLNEWRRQAPTWRMIIILWHAWCMSIVEGACFIFSRTQYTRAGLGKSDEE